MFVVVGDLFRYNREFLVGFVLVTFIVFFSCLSFFSPVNPDIAYSIAAFVLGYVAMIWLVP